MENGNLLVFFYSAQKHLLDFSNEVTRRLKRTAELLLDLLRQTR